MGAKRRPIPARHRVGVAGFEFALLDIEHGDVGRHAGSEAADPVLKPERFRRNME